MQKYNISWTNTFYNLIYIFLLIILNLNINEKYIPLNKSKIKSKNFLSEKKNPHLLDVNRLILRLLDRIFLVSNSLSLNKLKSIPVEFLSMA